MRKKRQTPGLWQQPAFRRLWTGSSVSLFGSQITVLAIPFTAALILHATAFQMGLLAMAEALPTLAGGFLIGVWVDRSRRRPLLIGADIARALLLCSIPLAALAGFLSIGYLIIVALLLGTGSLIFVTASIALLPLLVGSEQLIDANSKIEISNTLSQVAGPGIAGTLIQLCTAPIAMLIDAFSFLFSAACLALIEVEEKPAPGKQRQSIRQDLREGLRTVIDNPALRTIALCNATMNGFGGINQALLVLYLTRDLGQGATFYGLLYAVASLSGFCGALCNTWLLRRLGTGTALLLSSAAIGAGWLFLPIAGRASILHIPLVLLGALLFGVANTIFNVTENSLEQKITPQHLLGRVNACMNVIGSGTLPLGALLGGFLGTVLGLRPALLIAGCGLSLGFVWILCSPLRSMR